MHFVDDVDLVFSGSRLESRTLDEVADMVDPVVGSRVDFDHVNHPAFEKGAAVFAFVAGASVRGERSAIDGLGKNAGDGGLPCSARTVKKVSPDGAIL